MTSCCRADPVFTAQVHTCLILLQYLDDLLFFAPALLNHPSLA